MNAPNDNTAPKGLRGWWADPPRSGMQRIIWPFVYRRLRHYGRLCIAAGIVLTGLGVATLARGSLKTVAVAWAILFLAAAAVNFASAFWYLAIDHSASTRTRAAG
jgi:hypothetical protein